MLQNTKGIVLRAVKYGDTSVVATIFTSYFGVQSYMVQGVRSNKVKNNKAGLLQPSTMLDMVVYNKPFAGLQRIKEMQFAHLYKTLQQDIRKNSIALFSIELLLRLLPENAPAPELFDFSMEYFIRMDDMPADEIANFPLFFIIQCASLLGYELKGTYSATTPHLNLQEGGFSAVTPLSNIYTDEAEVAALDAIMKVRKFSDLKTVDMNAHMRFHLLEWYLAFLHNHTQHMGNIKSLAVLQAILH